MNKQENDKIQFTAADINRYLRGQMPAAEMYAIEKAALEDPFLADAIEGYNERMALSENDVQDDVDELKTRLETRVEPAVNKINSSIRWWRIAALLLLLAGTASIVYKIVNTSNLQEKSVITKNETAFQDTASNALAENNTVPIDTTAIALNDRAANTNAQASARDRNQSLYKSKKESPPKEFLRSMAPDPVRSADKPSESLRYDSENVVAGYTTVPKREEPALAESKSVLRKISPNTAADGNKATKEEDISKREQGAEPEIGFSEYNKYIENNKRTDTLSNQLHGDVVVSFFVDRKGRLSNFRIEKSLSKSMDKEAIRVIKKGPGWKVLQNKKTKVEYPVRF